MKLSGYFIVLESYLTYIKSLISRLNFFYFEVVFLDIVVGDGVPLILHGGLDPARIPFGHETILDQVFHGDLVRVPRGRQEDPVDGMVLGRVRTNRDLATEREALIFTELIVSRR